MPDYTPPATGGGGGAPTGAAGGDLGGTYPNPDIAAGVIVNADINTAAAIAQTKLADNVNLGVPGPDIMGYLSWTNDPHGVNANTAALAGGVLNLAMAPWPYTGKAITAVDICINTAATAATAGQCFIAIYSAAGGAALGSGAAETIFAQTNVRSVSISIAAGALPATGPGAIIYIATLFNGTTGPVLARWPNMNTALINTQNRASSSPRYGTFGTTQTAVPSLTVASIANAAASGGGSFWAGVR